jgi:ABC-type glycerol-3-phosphate transport system permease component
MTEHTQPLVSAVPTQREGFHLRLRISRGVVITYGLLTLGAIVLMLPFLWMLSASLKPPGEILVYPPQLVPTTWTLDNYNYVLFQSDYLIFVKNSLVIVFFTISGHVISGSLVAYGFARFRFPGRNLLFMLVLGTLMIPFQAYLIPRFWLMKQLGVLNSLTAVFLPYLFGGPLYIFLLRQFIMSIPKELDDAARIDGCGSFSVFRHIIFPLIRPAVVTVMVLEFLAAWTSFLEPLLYLNSLNNYTVSLGLTLFRSGVSGQIMWGPMMAATTLTAFAPLVVFFFAQKQLLGGISTMGIKG